MLEDGRDHHGLTLSVERSLPREHFVEHGPEREDVASTVGRRAIQPFRRQVVQGAKNHPFPREPWVALFDVLRGRSRELHPRQTEIEQDDARPGQHDVSGLQVAVEHAAAMRLGERVGDLDPVAQRLIEWDGAFREASRKGFPLEVLHDEEIHSAVTAHVEDVADMGMTECRECSRFAFEPLTPDRIFGVGGRQDFDGDGPLETRVPCRVHLAHPSSAERREDFVRAQALADGHTR